MICDYCHRDVEKVYRVPADYGDLADLCRACRNDMEYCESGGRIPQNPEDEP